ncbi:hypothetical protein CLM71_03115 [Serratia sp. MYb239]|nr:hypothetical protein CLM71_03115 [Serratia sp. MYb239]
MHRLPSEEADKITRARWRAVNESLLYPSYFKLQVCWLRSVTRITDLSKLIGIPSLAAFLQLELFRVYNGNFISHQPDKRPPGVNRSRHDARFSAGRR